MIFTARTQLDEIEILPAPCRVWDVHVLPALDGGEMGRVEHDAVDPKLFGKRQPLV